MGWTAFIGLAIFAYIMSIGYDPKKLPEWRANLVRKSATAAAYWICWMGGIFPRRIRKSADYKKWLGPSWTPTYDGAGIHISNHMSGYDPMIHWAVQAP